MEKITLKERYDALKHWTKANCRGHVMFEADINHDEFEFYLNSPEAADAATLNAFANFFDVPVRDLLINPENQSA
jgi:hypothetical protein